MNLISKERLSSSTGAASVTAPPLAPEPVAIDPSWRWAFAGLSVCILAMLGLFWQPASHIVYIWAISPTFNHGFLILPIVGYLAWGRRAALMASTPQPFMPGLALMAAAGAVWLLGPVADVFLVQQFALVGLIQTATLTLLGIRATRVLAFPLFYLLFAVPFGQMFVPHLQDVTAFFAVALLRGVGIPVFIEGVFLSTPTGNFHVAEACSGIRFLIATVALAFLYSHIMYRTMWRRTLFIGLAFVVPIVANGIRAFGIVYLAYVTDNEVAVGVDHLVYGWIFFAFVTLLMVMLGQTFREPPDSDEDPGTGQSAPAPSAPAGKGIVVVATVSALFVIGLAPAYAAIIANPVVERVDGAFAVPDLPGGWHRVDAGGRLWRPMVKGADAEALAAFRKNGRTVTLFVAYFTHQRQGSELIGSGHRLIGNDAWSRVSSATRSARIGQDDLTVKSTRIRRLPHNRIVWNWYWIGGEFTANPHFAKLLEARSKLFGGTPASAAVVASTTFDEVPSEAETALKDFLGDLGNLQTFLRQVTTAEK